MSGMRTREKTSVRSWVFELLEVMLPQIECPALGYLSMCLIWVAK